MKPEIKIMERMQNYKRNLSSINNETGRGNIQSRIDELKWVLRGEFDN